MNVQDHINKAKRHNNRAIELQKKLDALPERPHTAIGEDYAIGIKHNLEQGALSLNRAAFLAKQDGK